MVSRNPLMSDESFDESPERIRRPAFKREERMRTLIIIFIVGCLSNMAQAYCGYGLRYETQVYVPAKVECRVVEPARIEKVEVQPVIRAAVPVRGRPFLERRIQRLQGRASRAYARQSSAAVIVQPLYFKAKSS